MGRLRESLTIYPCLTCGGLKARDEFLFELVQRYTLTFFPTIGVQCETCRRILFKLEWGAEKDYDSKLPWISEDWARGSKVNKELKSGKMRPLRDIRGDLVSLGKPPHTLDCGRCKQERYPEEFTTPHPKHGQTHCVYCTHELIRVGACAKPIALSVYMTMRMRGLCEDRDHDGVKAWVFTAIGHTPF